MLRTATVARVVGVNWDITERVQMEQSALAAERTARDLLDRMLLATSATGLGVWEHVVANGELIWDPQMYQLFGRQPADGVPHDIWRQAVHPDDLPGVNAAVTESMHSGRRFEAEFRVLLPDGSLRWIAGRGLLRDGASGRSLLGVNWDITERRLAETALRAKDTAERASAAKSEFLSRMSHELRTPLNAILGFTQLLQLDGRQPLNTEQVERVDHIRQAGWHLLDLINEVLDLSRIEAGAARIDIHPVVVRDVLDECLTLIAADASLRRVRLDLHIRSTAASMVLADRMRLKQVVLNLLSNAVKYNRERGHVDIEVSSAQPGWCTICVRDTGHGISATKMDKLFQPFNRLGLESAKIEGTGIGLTIALRLAEQMGGRLEASSEPGRWQRVLPDAAFGARRHAAASVRISAPCRKRSQRCDGRRSRRTCGARRHRRLGAVRRGQPAQHGTGAAVPAVSPGRVAVSCARWRQRADDGAGLPARSHPARHATARYHGTCPVARGTAPAQPGACSMRGAVGQRITERRGGRSQRRCQRVLDQAARHRRAPALHRQPARRLR
jgi:signal transduction histidine kinase